MTAQKSPQTNNDDDVAAGQPQAPQSNLDDKVSVRGGKELDIRQEEERLLAKVVEKSREVDEEAERKISEHISEAKLARPEVTIPDEVKAAGVKSPQNDASEIIKKGGDLVLPVDQNELESGEKVKVTGKTYITKEVVGVRSFAAFAMLLARLVKIAHKHARRIIFRKRDSVEKPLAEGGK